METTTDCIFFPYMKNKILIFSFFILPAVTGGSSSFINSQYSNDDFVTCTIDPDRTTLKLYWKDDSGKPLKSLQALKDYCAAKKEKLIFAMNGGMYKEDCSPLGLFIQAGKTLTPVNKKMAVVIFTCCQMASFILQLIILHTFVSPINLLTAATFNMLRNLAPCF